MNIYNMIAVKLCHGSIFYLFIWSERRQDRILSSCTLSILTTLFKMGSGRPIGSVRLRTGQLFDIIYLINLNAPQIRSDPYKPIDF